MSMPEFATPEALIRKKTILVVDDEPDVVWATTRMLEKAGYTVLSGSTAAEASSLTKMHRPALVLLDVVLPDGDGLEVARQIKLDSDLAGVFVVLLSGIQISPQEQAVGLKSAQADGYVIKPFSNVDFLARIEAFLRIRSVQEALRESEERYRILFTRAVDGIFILSVNGKLVEVNESLARMHGYSTQEMLHMTLKDLDTPETSQLAPERMSRVLAGESLTFEVEHYHKDGHVFPLEVSVSLISSGGESCIQCFQRDITERKQAEEDLKESVEHLRRAIHTTIQVLVLAVETKDPYTAGHQKRTTNLARAMAAEMNLPPEKIEGLRMAGAIHDIGKISIPSEILSKPTELPAIEYSLIKEHARHGYEILKDVESPWPLADIVYQHHERINGSGYPRGLKGEEILIEARILAVADVVEAMASHRPYRPALGMGAALEEIEKNRGILYDPAAVETCLRLIREKGFQLEVDAYPIDKSPLRPGRGRNMPPAVPGQEVPN